MKVVILSNRDVRGGAAVAAYRLFKALRSIGVDASMLVKDKFSDEEHIHSILDDPIKKAKAVAKEYGERLLLFQKIEEKKERFNFSTGRWGNAILDHPLIKEADVIHLHWINKSFISLETVQVLARTKKVVWTFHDMWSFTGGCHYAQDCRGYENSCGNCPLLKTSQRGDGDLSRKLWIEKDRRILKADITGVACSHWLRDTALTSSIWAQKKVTSIPNPIDTDFFTPKYGFSSKLKLVFIARSIDDRRKGFDILKGILESDHFSPEERSRLALYLGGSSESDIKIPGIEVEMAGFLNGAEAVRDLYRKGDVLLLPSREDNLPNTVVEASACGLATIAFGVGGVPQMIREGETGFCIQPFDKITFAKAIKTLLKMKADGSLGQMQEAARAFALEQYSPKAVANKYLEVYRS